MEKYYGKNMTRKILDLHGLMVFWSGVKQYINNIVANLATKDEIRGLSKIYHVDGYSDGDGYITTEIVPQEDGYNITIISRLFLHPTLNTWTPVISYQTISGNNNVLVTGGLRGSAVILGGSIQAQTFPNCLYRVFYLKEKI